MGYITHEDGDEHWHLPFSDSVKDNINATIFEETDCYNHVFTIRNHAWILVEARSRCKKGEPSPYLVEAMWIREVLSWIKENNQDNVILEPDCLQVVLFVAPSFASFTGEEWLVNVVTCLQTLVTKTRRLDLLNGERI